MYILKIQLNYFKQEIWPHLKMPTMSTRRILLLEHFLIFWVTRRILRKIQMMIYIKKIPTSGVRGRYRIRKTLRQISKNLILKCQKIKKSRPAPNSLKIAQSRAITKKMMLKSSQMRTSFLQMKKRVTALELSSAQEDPVQVAAIIEF